LCADKDTPDTVSAKDVAAQSDRLAAFSTCECIKSDKITRTYLHKYVHHNYFLNVSNFSRGRKTDGENYLKAVCRNSNPLLKIYSSFV
jgi:hypothetical protein